MRADQNPIAHPSIIFACTTDASGQFAPHCRAAYASLRSLRTAAILIARSPEPVPAELAKPAGPKQRAPDECWECGERLYGKYGRPRGFRFCARVFLFFCFFLRLPVGVRVASAYDHNWHMDCFKCNVCKTTLVGVAFYPEGDEVVCAKHIGASGAPSRFVLFCVFLRIALTCCASPLGNSGQHVPQMSADN